MDMTLSVRPHKTVQVMSLDLTLFDIYVRIVTCVRLHVCSCNSYYGNLS